MIYSSPLPDVEIPDLPLTAYVLDGTAGQPDKPALIDGASGQTLTYADLGRTVRSLAGGLAASGFAKGEVLALMAPNMPAYAVVFHAVAMAGGIVTTINPAYGEAEMHGQLRDSGARILVTIPQLAAAASRAAAGTQVREVYVFGEAPGARPLASLHAGPLAGQVPVAPGDVVALPYSSGTVGLSKGVMLTHRNLVANIAQTLAITQIMPEESLVAVLPFFHIYGMQVLMNCGLRAGATIVTLPRFDLEQFLRVHQDYRITRSFVAPPIVLALATVGMLLMSHGLFTFGNSAKESYDRMIDVGIPISLGILSTTFRVDSSIARILSGYPGRKIVPLWAAPQSAIAKTTVGLFMGI